MGSQPSRLSLAAKLKGLTIGGIFSNEKSVGINLRQAEPEQSFNFRPPVRFPMEESQHPKIAALSKVSNLGAPSPDMLAHPPAIDECLHITFPHVTPPA